MDERERGDSPLRDIINLHEGVDVAQREFDVEERAVLKAEIRRSNAVEIGGAYVLAERRLYHAYAEVNQRDRNTDKLRRNRIQVELRDRIIDSMCVGHFVPLGDRFKRLHGEYKQMARKTKDDTLEQLAIKFGELGGAIPPRGTPYDPRQRK